MIPFFCPYLLISYTVFLQTCGDILISSFVLSQFFTDQTSYALTGRFNPGTTHMCDYSVGGCVLNLVSLETYFQSYHPNSSFLYLTKHFTPW